MLLSVVLATFPVAASQVLITDARFLSESYPIQQFFANLPSASIGPLVGGKAVPDPTDARDYPQKRQITIATQLQHGGHLRLCQVPKARSAVPGAGESRPSA